MFLFKSVHARRDQHSFPTRRSSDLSVRDAAAPQSGRGAWLDGVRLRATRLVRIRSEEHTSELQSQSNLVCRLLLEKKNREISLILLVSSYAPGAALSRLPDQESVVM